MNRSIIALGVLAACGTLYSLAEEDKTGGTPRLVRFLGQAIQLADGSTQSWVTVTRQGDFSDPRYGQFSITLAMLEQMVANFNARVLGQDVFIDVSHAPSNGAAGKVLKLSVESGRLRALVEWTQFGVDAIKQRGFTYLSAEFADNWQDNEKQAQHGCVLLGAGLTIRPVIKHLEPVQLSTEDGDHDVPARVCVSPQLLKELTEQSMNYLDQLRIKLLSLGLSEAVVVKLLAEAKKQLDAAAKDEAKCLAIVTTWEETGKAVQDQLKTLSAGGDKNVTITLAAPTVDVEAAVAKALSDHATAAATAQTTLVGKMKLLSDTIAAGDPTLDAGGVKTLAEQMAPLVTATSTDDQVKALAQIQVDNAKKLSAAQKLVQLGYTSPNGNLQITVESSNGIKSLQATIDKRLGFEGMPDHERYKKTGGKLPQVNKDFAEKALAVFDAANAAQLDREHKALSAGTGVISDVKVPVIAERTVLRESLYGLTSLNFVNVGTAPFANVITVPYSYRDTSAAGVGALRRYEGQGIRRAGVIQTHEEARPLPQKLSFRLSKEIQLLMSASIIDFDPIAENVRNIIRIVGEDTEAINMNELVVSADESGIGAGNDTLTAQCNGTNKVFVTTQFPVVRPRKVYDLQGGQVGSTANPVTVTLNAVARSEYVLPADGSALAAGTYWVMDWNLGELRFVNEVGAPVTPTNGWALVVTYSYSTNVAKFDTDLGALKVDEKYDLLLTAIGGRKTVIETDRYKTANMVLMSGGLDNALTQAKSFTANGQRTATGLAADGSVGFTKGMPTFNPTAPGLMLNDNRILVGERGNTRFRMVKAFAMTPLEQARDTNGNFTDQQEAFGTQFVLSHTPTQLKNSLTSLIVYSATGRVARA